MTPFIRPITDGKTATAKPIINGLKSG